MAVGDVVTGHSSVAASASLTIQPGTGIEWVIHNLYYGAAMELYRTDGANTIKIDSDTSLGCRMGTVFHLTNSIYLTLKNVSAGTAYFGYDGIVTK